MSSRSLHRVQRRRPLLERCTFSSFLQLAVVLKRRRRFVVVRTDLTCPSADLPPATTFFFLSFFDEILRFVPLLVSPVNRPPAPVCARVSVLFLFVCVCVCFVRVCYRSCKQDGCVICGGDRPPVPLHRLRSSHPPLLGLRAPPIAPVTRARAPSRTLDPVVNGCFIGFATVPRPRDTSHWWSPEGAGEATC